MKESAIAPTNFSPRTQTTTTTGEGCGCFSSSLSNPKYWKMKKKITMMVKTPIIKAIHCKRPRITPNNREAISKAIVTKVEKVGKVGKVVNVVKVVRLVSWGRWGRF
jgi:hypothetical protein